jgi:hypothetical protein
MLTLLLLLLLTPPIPSLCQSTAAYALFVKLFIVN